jgi:CSLREA domain-containing protein
MQTSRAVTVLSKRAIRLAALALAGAALVPAGAGAATINVTTVTDEAGASTDCALREAIAAAADNQDIGGCDTGVEVVGAYGSGSDRDTVVLGPQTYELTVNSPNEDLNGGGDLDTLGGGPVTVRGASQTGTIVRTDLDERIFDVSTAGELRLEQMTVTNGEAFILGSQSGGNIRAAQPGSTLILDRVTVSRGHGFTGGGVVVNGDGSHLSITDSLIVNNLAERNGGGVATGFDTTMDIARTRFEINKAIDDDSASQALGGAISESGDAFTVTDSEFVGNQVSATDPDTAGNGFVNGGAISLRGDGDDVIRGSLFVGNFAETNSVDEREEGGAIRMSGTGTKRIVNSTFHGNRAGDAGTPEGKGGAILRDSAAVSSSLTIAHSTLSDNDAVGPGADQVHHDDFAEGTLTLAGSILTRTVPGDACQGTPTNPIVSAGFNAADPDPGDNCGFGATDSTTGSPIGLVAGGPQPNGGPTGTIALDPSGRAVNLVPAAQCGPAEGVDQRGSARPVGLNCDAGAYEAALPTCAGATATQVGTEGADTLTGTPGADVIVALGGNDRVSGLAGKDVVCGGLGRDRLNGGAGKDRLLGQGGKDKLRGGKGKDLCKGGPAKDKASACERKRSI